MGIDNKDLSFGEIWVKTSSGYVMKEKEKQDALHQERAKTTI